MIPISQSRTITISSRVIGIFCCLSIAVCTFFALLSAYYYNRYHTLEEKSQQQEAESQQTQEQVEELNEELQFQKTLSRNTVAGAFALLASLVAILHMTSHLRHFNRPEVQRKIMAILWMSPIYSLTSWLGFVFPQAEGYLLTIKDFYEAYVIYQFLSFLIAVLSGGGDRQTVVDLLARHADHLKPPMRFMKCFFYPDPRESNEALANAVLLECQIFGLQFVFLRPLTSVLMLVCDELIYKNGGEKWSWRSPYLYIVIVENISIFTAFTGLLKFYHAVHEDIEFCRPWPKFLCIKGVVFMTFWQGTVISLTVASTPIDSTNYTDPAELSSQIQNFVICIEMLFFAIAHYCYFPWEEWEEGYSPENNGAPVQRLGDNLALRDFVSDVQMVVRSSHTSIKQRKHSKKGTVVATEEPELELAESVNDSDENKSDNEIV